MFKYGGRNLSDNRWYSGEPVCQLLIDIVKRFFIDCWLLLMKVTKVLLISNILTLMPCDVMAVIMLISYFAGFILDVSYCSVNWNINCIFYIIVNINTPIL